MSRTTSVGYPVTVDERDHEIGSLRKLVRDQAAEIARLTAELADARTAMEVAMTSAERRGAKVDALTAELAAARAVPADVEAAIAAAVSGAAEVAVASHLRHAHLLTDDRAYTVPRLRAAIARAIAEARQPAPKGG